MMKKILFVCLGNICRSPMAEYILRDMAQKRGIAVNVASAGTSGWHDGEYMHCGTAEILDGLSIESRDFRSRKIPTDALQYYDYVIVMDDSNLRDVQAALGNDKRIFKITDLLGEGSLPAWKTCRKPSVSARSTASPSHRRVAIPAWSAAAWRTAASS